MVVCSVQVCATLGTTGACAFDKLEELGPICKYNGTTIFILFFIILAKFYDSL